MPFVHLPAYVLITTIKISDNLHLLRFHMLVQNIQLILFGKPISCSIELDLLLLDSMLASLVVLVVHDWHNFGLLLLNLAFVTGLLLLNLALGTGLLLVVLSRQNIAKCKL